MFHSMASMLETLRNRGLIDIISDTPCHSEETTNLLEKIQHSESKRATFSFVPAGTVDPITLEPVRKYYFRCNGPRPHFFNRSTVLDYIKRQCCKALTCSVDRTYQIETRLYRNPEILIIRIDEFVENGRYDTAANACTLIASSFEDSDDPRGTFMIRGAFHNKAMRLYELSGNIDEAILAGHGAASCFEMGVANHSSQLARDYAQELKTKTINPLL